MTCNPEKSLENSDSRDFTSKYSSPFPLLEFEERKKSLEIDKVLPLEENLQSLLQRLQEAQTKSIQNRMSLINDLTKEKKNFEKEVEISLKQDDLVQFFTNNGELRTLNEENIEMENYIEENKLNEISTSPNQKFANSPKPKNQNQKSLQMGSNYNNNTKYNNIDKNLKVKDNEDNVDFLEEIGSEGKTFPVGKATIPSLYVKPSAMPKENKRISVRPLEALEGWFKKKSPHIVQGWQKRFCRIAEKKFFYFKPNDLENPMGVLDFEICAFDFIEIKKNEILTGFIFRPKNCQKTFIFKAPSKRKESQQTPTIEVWVSTIKNHLSHALGQVKGLSNLSKIPRFWRDNRITENRFKTKADTLDVLLFRGKNLASKIQRSLTGSQYDHVALILRYGNNELVLLEATGKEGVGLCSWSCFMRNKWHLLYKKLVLRHLEIKRTDKMIETLEKFVKQVIGKKFSVNLSKLLKKKSENLDIDSSKSFEGKTFFCSELVAAAYKVLDILPKELAASRYYPGAFSKERKLKLKNGARLTEEVLIDFTL